jgi:hypothetical protein
MVSSDTRMEWKSASCPHITHPKRAVLPLQMDYLDAFDFVLCSVNQLWLLFPTTLRYKAPYNYERPLAWPPTIILRAAFS